VTDQAAIIIPAHNEEAVIGHTLRCLLDGLNETDATVVVAANGCTDNTVARARSIASWIVVLDLAQPGKSQAIRAAEVQLGPGPRLYLDADVCLPGTSALAVLDRLRNGAGGARPPAVTDLTGTSWSVRSFHRARGRLPNVRQEFSGGGCYGLSWDVRQTFGEFPDVLGDDLFAARVVPQGQAEIIDAPPVVIRPPRDAASLRRVLARNVRGNRQLGGMFPDIAGLTTKQTVASLVRSVRGPSSLFDAGIYASFVTAGRLGARRSNVRWERDESSRIAEQPA
jgi:glycosyltransferase involved in cell wall biosynthesis